jgi:salicylate hydroxylase
MNAEYRRATSPSIVILGGGIGGLAAAAFLYQAGLACTVYEQAAQLREIGAGLVVAPNGARLLRQLGVLDAFEEHAVRWSARPLPSPFRRRTRACARSAG